MGKKSKKGKTRAGKTARPSAGKGKTGKARTRSSSQSGSVVSREDVASVDAEPTMEQKDNVKNLSPPESVSMPTKTEAVEPEPVAAAEAAPEPVEAVSEPVVSTPEPTGAAAIANGNEENTPVPREESGAVPSEKTLEKEMPVVAAAAAESEKGEEVWSNNLRDVVSDNVADDEPAVLDVTIDEGESGNAAGVKSRDDEPAVLDVTSDEGESGNADNDAVAVVKSRTLPVDSKPRAGIVDLGQPAAEEAKAKQKDCNCIIL